MADPRHLESRGLKRLALFAGDWTVLLDEMSRIVYELGSRDAIFGGEPNTSSLGRRIAAFVHPDDMVFAVDRMEESLSEPGSQISFEIRAGLAELGYRTVDVVAVNCFNDPLLNGVILKVTAS